KGYSTNRKTDVDRHNTRCRIKFVIFFFFFQAEDGIRDRNVTGVQTCALPISQSSPTASAISGTIAMKCGIPDSAVFSEARFTESFWFFVRPGAMIGSMKTGSRSQASRIRDRSLPSDSVVLVFSVTSQD